MTRAATFLCAVRRISVALLQMLCFEYPPSRLSFYLKKRAEKSRHGGNVTLKSVETLYKVNARDIIGCLEKFLENLKESVANEKVTLLHGYAIVVTAEEGPVIYYWGDTDELKTIGTLHAIANDVESTYLAGFDGVLPTTGPGAA